MKKYALVIYLWLHAGIISYRTHCLLLAQESPFAHDFCYLKQDTRLQCRDVDSVLLCSLHGPCMMTTRLLVHVLIVKSVTITIYHINYCSEPVITTCFKNQHRDIRSESKAKLQKRYAGLISSVASVQCTGMVYSTGIPAKRDGMFVPHKIAGYKELSSYYMLYLQILSARVILLSENIS